MNLVTCIVLALVNSHGVQPIRDWYDESNVLSEYWDESEDDPNCPKDETSRIANGYDAKEGDFPFIVALIKWKMYPTFKDQFCVGSLLTFEFILTACHCLVKGDKIRIRYPHDILDPNTIHISAGTVDLINYIRRREEGAAKYGQIRSGKKSVVHPKCSRSMHKITHDFGLLKADRPFLIVPVFVPAQIKPLEFNVSKKYDPKHRAEVDKMAKNHTLCVTMGWGLNAQLYSVNILQVIKATMRPGDWCSEAIKNITIHQETGPDIFSSNSQICVVGCGAGQTTCPGDSGGPLLCGKKKEFLGVVSYGPGDNSCGADKSPFVYARVDVDDLWIWTTIAEWIDDDITPKSIAAIPASYTSTMAAMSVIIVIKLIVQVR